MLEKIPTNEEMIALLGQSLFDVWTDVQNLVEANYDMDKLWNSGGKRWVYEYKYRRGGKTLCALYAKQDVFGFMLIFGKDERAKVDAIRAGLTPETQHIYDEATTYHDGKWVMFELTDTALFLDMEKLLSFLQWMTRGFQI
ncbi:DUF3788 domain-containing protein [Scatolibacter rhodanostii]|uniref:DUF3788 domain-containing protein n=1 Tax=Scatolibacter rhodanostii TaxID=2014781 RepID=UPI000C07A2E9|nr:DUF3788 domain-containing protein [Scatolibacter rhodanostii]